MSIKDLRDAADSDLAGSYNAMLRAARYAQDLAIKTNTGIVISEEGESIFISAKESMKMRLSEIKSQKQ